MPRFSRLLLVPLTVLTVLAGCFGSAPLPAQAAGGSGCFASKYTRCFAEGETHLIVFNGEADRVKFSFEKNRYGESAVNLRAFGQPYSPISFKVGEAVFEYEFAEGIYAFNMRVLDICFWPNWPNDVLSVLPKSITGGEGIAVFGFMGGTGTKGGWVGSAFYMDEDASGATFVDEVYYLGFTWDSFSILGMRIVMAWDGASFRIYRDGDTALLGRYTYRVVLRNLSPQPWWVNLDGSKVSASQLIRLELVGK